MIIGVLDNITRLIQSPPGQVIAGGVLAGIVWKFFERVESVLTDQTKLEIAVWLLGVRIGQKVEPWPETFARVFDRVFTSDHLSWKCFRRSSIASMVSFTIIYFASILSGDRTFRLPLGSGSSLGFRVASFIVGGLAPDFFSLLKTRVVLIYMERTSIIRKRIEAIVIDFVLTVGFGFVSLFVATIFQNMIVGITSIPMQHGRFRNSILATVINLGSEPGELRSIGLHGAGLWFYPAFFTSIWLWLYAGSGFLLKAARHFDIGFQWFNGHADIEHKPLQAIGLVAGVLVAIVYWSAIVVSRMF